MEVTQTRSRRKVVQKRTTMDRDATTPRGPWTNVWCLLSMIILRTRALPFGLGRPSLPLWPSCRGRRPCRTASFRRGPRTKRVGMALRIERDGRPGTHLAQARTERVGPGRQSVWLCTANDAFARGYTPAQTSTEHTQARGVRVLPVCRAVRAEVQLGAAIGQACRVVGRVQRLDRPVLAEAAEVRALRAWQPDTHRAHLGAARGISGTHRFPRRALVEGAG